MMDLYSTLLCIAVHPKRFTIMWGGGGVSPQPPPVVLIHFNISFIPVMSKLNFQQPLFQSSVSHDPSNRVI